MIKAIICDFSRVLLFPKDKNYTGSLNELHRKKAVIDNYNLHHHFQLNTELIEYLQNVKTKQDLYLFTSETIQEAPELQPVLKETFIQIFSAIKLGISKKDPRAYKNITENINLSPHEVLFIDDTKENITAAKEAGLNVILYTDNKQLFLDLNNYLET